MGEGDEEREGDQDDERMERERGDARVKSEMGCTVRGDEGMEDVRRDHKVVEQGRRVSLKRDGCC